MKLTEIRYRRLFPTGNFTNEAIELTGSLSDNEDVMQAYTELHKMAQELHFSKNAELYEMRGEQVRNVEPEQPMDKIKGWIQVINLCTNKTALERFKTRVDEENVPELTQAYNDKLKTFTNE